MLFCPTFRVRSSGLILVDVYRFPLPSPGEFGQFSPGVTIHPGIFTNEFPSGFFFCNFFVIFTGIRCGTVFFVTPMRSSGSRVDIAQKPNKSGQILDQRWKIYL